MNEPNRNVLNYEGLQYFYQKLSPRLLPPYLINAVDKNTTDILAIQEQLEGVGENLADTFLKVDGSNRMTGNLTIANSLYPSVYLHPLMEGQTNYAVFQGSYVGSASFGIWETNTGADRRILEVNTKKYKNSLDDAIYLRVFENGTPTSYRVYHEGMTSGLPVEAGGTGATTPSEALTNLNGVGYTIVEDISGLL